MPRREDPRSPDRNYYARAAEQEAIRRVLEEESNDFAAGGAVAPPANRVPNPRLGDQHAPYTWTGSNTSAVNRAVNEARELRAAQRAAEELRVREQVRREQVRRQDTLREWYEEMVARARFPIVGRTNPNAVPTIDVSTPTDWSDLFADRNVIPPDSQGRIRNEQEESVPGGQKVRLPDRQYSFVVHQTDSMFSPYLLINGVWYIITPPRRLGGDPTMRPINPADVRYYIDPAGMADSRMDVVYGGVRYELPDNQRGPQE